MAPKKLFTAEEKRVLKEAWENGMRRMNSDQVPVMAEKLACSCLRIKNWIGNHKKEVEGRVYERKKGLYLKGKSAYNQFCQDKKGQKTDFKEWAAEWRALSQEEKDAYKGQAKTSAIGDQEKKKRKLLDLLKKTVDELNKLGVAVGGVCIEGAVLSVFGVDPIRSYLNQDKVLAGLYPQANKEVPQHSTQEDKRREVQKIFNEQYSNAIGSRGKMPYKDVGVTMEIGTNMEGLVIKRPSSYGSKALQEIINFHSEHGLELIITRQQVEEPVPDSMELPPADQPLTPNSAVVDGLEIKTEPQQEISAMGTINMGIKQEPAWLPA